MAAVVHDCSLRTRNKAVAAEALRCKDQTTRNKGGVGVAETKSAKKAQDATSADKVIIKKYANRRLYNTRKSSYVTLDDLSKMVRDGEDFAVFDAKSGDDITRSVLTQIIVEEEAKEQNMLPTNFLRELIRLYGDPLQGVVPGYLDAAMQAFSKNQDQMRKAFGGGAAFGNFESMARANMEFFEPSMKMFSPFGVAGKSSPAAPAEETTEDKSSDIEDLQEQLRQMQRQLEKLSKS